MSPKGGSREGAGRKPVYKSGPGIRLSFRLPPDLNERLLARADLDHLTVSQALVAAVAAYLGDEAPVEP